MASPKKQLVERFAELHEATAHLRDVLLRYDKVTTKVVALIEKGESMVGAIERISGPVRRSEVTDAMEAFEAARHQARLAMFTVAEDEPSNTSDMGRALGISRQLASRLAAAAREKTS